MTRAQIAGLASMGALALVLCAPAASIGQVKTPLVTQVVRQAPTMPPIQIVNVYQPPRAAEPAKDTSSDVWMVRLTLLLVFAGFIQALIFAAQLFVGYNQLRAYVFLEDAKIKITDFGSSEGGTKWIASYVVKNAGVTPAHKVKVLDIITVENWFPDKLPVPTSDDYLGSMAPGGDFIDSDSDELVTLPDDNKAITSKTATKAIFLVGRITYQDVFRFTHTTNFCFYWKGPVGDEPVQMTAYDEGNDST